MNWTHYGFPENCPPNDAREYEGLIYVYVKHSPPVYEDFRTVHDKGTYPDKDPCQRRSISCGTNIEYLNKKEILFPATKGWKKAAGKIKLDDGLIKQTTTDPLHHSFWVSPEKRENFNELFEVI
jgi:hypothetical protein